jgi:hypothetical protein
MHKSESMEITITSEGSIWALAAGIVWLINIPKRTQIRIMKLPNYGIGIGRGILNNGLLCLNSETLVFGEYFRNPEKTYVRIFQCNLLNFNNQVLFEFSPGSIRHIHALQKDPYTNKLWLCTGDSDTECMIAWSNDGYKTIHPIGGGTQIWRTCQLVFDETHIFWGTDSDSDELSGIYSWNKNTAQIKKIQKVEGAILFGTLLNKGTIIMSMDREGFKNEKDDKVVLHIYRNNYPLRKIVFGSWKKRKSKFRFDFAKIRLSRNQNNKVLTATCLNHNELPQSMLIIVDEDELMKKINNLEQK